MFSEAERLAIDQEITPEIWAALELLRDNGFAVAAFCPTELQGVRTKHVEDRMVELGWDVIELLKNFPDVIEEA
jgi:hypothetical protein